MHVFFDFNFFINIRKCSSKQWLLPLDFKCMPSFVRLFFAVVPDRICSINDTRHSKQSVPNGCPLPARELAGRGLRFPFVKSCVCFNLCQILQPLKRPNGSSLFCVPLTEQKTPAAAITCSLVRASVARSQTHRREKASGGILI